ncbi:MAG: hypothetical protein Q9157_008095 [Trypethelium eluteriae]
MAVADKAYCAINRWRRKKVRAQGSNAKGELEGEDGGASWERFGYDQYMGAGKAHRGSWGLGTFIGSSQWKTETRRHSSPRLSGLEEVCGAPGRKYYLTAAAPPSISLFGSTTTTQLLSTSA